MFRLLNLARAKTETDPENSGSGADDFLPLFIWVVLRSKVPRLKSNCEYIMTFHSPVRLMGKSGYCFVNLCSAIEFILSVDGEQVTMDPKEFDAKLAAAEAAHDKKQEN